MKFALPFALAFGLLPTIACSHTSSSDTTVASDTPATTNSSTAEPTAKEGWSKVKEGTREVGQSAGDKSKEVGQDLKQDAKDVGHGIAQGARDTGRAIKATACPVLANKTTRAYYTKTDRSYTTLLSGDKALPSENRECFSTEANAREAGYHAAQ